MGAWREQLDIAHVEIYFKESSVKRRTGVING